MRVLEKELLTLVVKLLIAAIKSSGWKPDTGLA